MIVKPDSVHPLARADVYSSGPCLATRVPVSGEGFKLPTRKLNARATQASLFGIAPDKAFLAGGVTAATGGLLHRHFTLAKRMETPRGLFLWSWLCIAAASR